MLIARHVHGATAYRVPVRYGQVMVLWMAIVIGYVLRINMSVGVVAMTSEKFASDFGYPVSVVE